MRKPSRARGSPGTGSRAARSCTHVASKRAHPAPATARPRVLRPNRIVVSYERGRRRADRDDEAPRRRAERPKSLAAPRCRGPAGCGRLSPSQAAPRLVLNLPGARRSRGGARVADGVTPPREGRREAARAPQAEPRRRAPTYELGDRRASSVFGAIAQRAGEARAPRRCAPGRAPPAGPSSTCTRGQAAAEAVDAARRRATRRTRRPVERARAPRRRPRGRSRPPGAPRARSRACRRRSRAPSPRRPAARRGTCRRRRPRPRCPSARRRRDRRRRRASLDSRRARCRSPARARGRSGRRRRAGRGGGRSACPDATATACHAAVKRSARALDGLEPVQVRHRRLPRGPHREVVGACRDDDADAGGDQPADRDPRAPGAPRGAPRARRPSG